MLTLTSDQETALALESQRVVVCVKIDLDTDLFYCTGAESVTIGSDTYTPRGLSFGSVSVTDPRNSRATVRLDDTDGVIAGIWYGERFSGVTVTVKEAIKSGGDWVVIRSIPWVCTVCSRNSKGEFIIELAGAGGFRPRAGLAIATREDFHLAPAPATPIMVGGSWVLT